MKCTHNHAAFTSHPPARLGSPGAPKAPAARALRVLLLGVMCALSIPLSCQGPGLPCKCFGSLQRVCWLLCASVAPLASCLVVYHAAILFGGGFRARVPGGLRMPMQGGCGVSYSVYTLGRINFGHRCHGIRYQRCTRLVTAQAKMKKFGHVHMVQKG